MIRAIGAVLVALGGLTLAAYGLVWLVLTGRGEMDWDVPYIPVEQKPPLTNRGCPICRGTGYETRSVHKDFGDGIAMGGQISTLCSNGCPTPFTRNSAPVAARRNHR